MLSALASGCTSLLLDAARGKPGTLAAEDLRVRVATARLLSTENDGFIERRIEICLERRKLVDRDVADFLVRIAYPSAGKPPIPFVISKDDSLIYRASTVSKGCELKVPRDARLIANEPVPLVLAPESGELEFELPRAVYVAYENDSMAGLGYFDTQPLFGEERHTFDIDMTGSGLYSEIQGRKPYLYALAPITAAGDAVIVTFVVGRAVDEEDC